MSAVLGKTSTAEVLAGMLVENTGASILDSGGAYGRHWERNKGKTVTDWEAEPKAHVGRWGVTLSTFHYLNERLTFAPEIQEKFERFAAQNPDEWGMGLAELFAEEVVELGGRYLDGFNSYNYDSALSQTIQGVRFELGGDVFVLLQIHGGCDVRGGYTEPKAFLIDVEMPEAFPYDFNDYLLDCPKCGEGWSVQAGEVFSRDGDYLRGFEFPTTDDGLTCPECGGGLIADAHEPI